MNEGSVRVFKFATDREGLKIPSVRSQWLATAIEAVLGSLGVDVYVHSVGSDPIPHFSPFAFILARGMALAGYAVLDGEKRRAARWLLHYLGRSGKPLFHEDEDNTIEVRSESSRVQQLCGSKYHLLIGTSTWLISEDWMAAYTLDVYDWHPCGYTTDGNLGWSALNIPFPPRLKPSRERWSRIARILNWLCGCRKEGPLAFLDMRGESPMVTRYFWYLSGGKPFTTYVKARVERL